MWAIPGSSALQTAPHMQRQPRREPAISASPARAAGLSKAFETEAEVVIKEVGYQNPLETARSPCSGTPLNKELRELTEEVRL